MKVKDKKVQTGYESVYIWFISQGPDSLFSDLWSMGPRMEGWEQGCE